MKTIVIDDKTAQRLRMFVASTNYGRIHGKLGSTAALAINSYIDQDDAYIDSLCRNLLVR